MGRLRRRNRGFPFKAKGRNHSTPSSSWRDAYAMDLLTVDDKATIILQPSRIVCVSITNLPLILYAHANIVSFP